MIDNIECKGLPHESLKTGEKRKKKKGKVELWRHYLTGNC